MEWERESASVWREEEEDEQTGAKGNDLLSKLRLHGGRSKMVAGRDGCGIGQIKYYLN